MVRHMIEVVPVRPTHTDWVHFQSSQFFHLSLSRPKTGSLFYGFEVPKPLKQDGGLLEIP